jgi:hypothetical protein
MASWRGHTSVSVSQEESAPLRDEWGLADVGSLYDNAVYLALSEKSLLFAWLAHPALYYLGVLRSQNLSSPSIGGGITPFPL